MTFHRSRFNKQYEWELTRFCNIKNTTVIGGASKLLKYFIANYNPRSIISYADIRISNGNLYNELGFIKLHINKPSYWYIKKPNYLILYHHSNFTKNKIGKLFPDIDISRTEEDIMLSNGYDKIYDCGTVSYGLIIDNKKPD
jgi:hypothetical protein